MGTRALLCGINRYLAPGADLRGCRNDVEDMRAVLRDLYGVADGDIRLLVDTDATKANLEAAFTALLADARPGDVRYFHFSGHGSNVTDQDDDEEHDRRDEILCPCDLDWFDPLRDDWLRTQLDAVPDGVNLTIVTDCCYSGTVTRRIDPPDAPLINRYLPAPADLMRVESRRELRGTARQFLTTLDRSALTSDVVEVDLPEVLLTGCRDDQTSADAYIDGDYHGAMTYSLVNALRELGTDSSYRAVHTRMLELLAGEYDQVPQLEGRRERVDRPFLAPLR